MARAFTLHRAEQSMMDNGTQASTMVLASSNGQMDLSTKVNGGTAEKTAKANL